MTAGGVTGLNECWGVADWGLPSIFLITTHHACYFLDSVVAFVRERHKKSGGFCGNDRASFDLMVDFFGLVCHEANFVCRKVNFVCHEANFVCRKVNFVCHEVNFVCHEVMSLRDAKTCVHRKPNLE